MADIESNGKGYEMVPVTNVMIPADIRKGITLTWKGGKVLSDMIYIW